MSRRGFDPANIRTSLQIGAGDPALPRLDALSYGLSLVYVAALLAAAGWIIGMHVRVYYGSGTP